MSTTVISLKKDAKVEITKSNPGLTKVHVGLGWDVSAAKATGEFDLDVFAFVYHNGVFGKKLENVVFYGTKKDPSLDNYPMVQLSEDNRTGEGDGDDEFIKVDFAALPADVTALVLGVSIYDAQARAQNFGMVKNSFITISPDGGSPIVRYDLQEDYGKETMVIMGKLYKHTDGEWKFEAMGDGLEADIEQAVSIY